MIYVNPKQLAIASVTAVVCGKALRVAQDNPKTAKTLLSYSAASALVGATWGVGVAYYRKAPLHIYGVATGVNFAICSFALFGMRHALLTNQVWRYHLSEQQHKYLCSTVSGGTVGALSSILSRHSVAMIAGTGAGGLVVGLLGQWISLRFHHWRIKRSLLLYDPELVNPNPRRQLTLKAFEEWFLGFWHQRSKVTRVESELTVLENDIAMEEKKIADLDRKLAELDSTNASHCNI